MTVITASARDQLQAVQDRKRQARERVAKARKARQMALDGGDSEMLSIAETALQTASDEQAMAGDLETQLLRQLNGLPGAPLGDRFLDNPDTLRELEQLAGSSAPVGSVNLGLAVGRDELVSMIESGSWGLPKTAVTSTPSLPDEARISLPYGIVPQLRRRLRVTDLIPTATMEGNSFTYTIEGGSFETAAETADLDIKPSGDLDLSQEGTVEAKTIAHWLKLARPQLADVPGLGTTTYQRLVYGVMRRLDNQIVAGDGTGNNLLGITHTAGIASVAFDAGTPLTDLTLDAITDVLLGDAEPNGVVLNPSDMATMLKAKATGSGERLDSDGAFATPPTEIWGLPAIASKVMPQGQALVGDFAQGASLFVREGVNVRISDADSDDFVRNRVTYLGEGRFGIAVWRPACFALVHFS